MDRLFQIRNKNSIFFDKRFLLNQGRTQVQNGAESPPRLERIANYERQGGRYQLSKKNYEKILKNWNQLRMELQKKAT